MRAVAPRLRVLLRQILFGGRSLFLPGAAGGPTAPAAAHARTHTKEFFKTQSLSHSTLARQGRGLAHTSTLTAQAKNKKK